MTPGSGSRSSPGEFSIRKCRTGSVGRMSGNASRARTGRASNYYVDWPQRAATNTRPTHVYRTPQWFWVNYNRIHTHTHTHLTALCPGLPGWAGTRKVKPVWILLKQQTVSGSGIRWTICKPAPCSRLITTPAPTTQFFTGRMPFLPPKQQHQSIEDTCDDFRQCRQGLDRRHQHWLCWFTPAYQHHAYTGEDIGPITHTHTPV